VKGKCHNDPGIWGWGYPDAFACRWIYAKCCRICSLNVSLITFHFTFGVHLICNTNPQGTLISMSCVPIMVHVQVPKQELINILIYLCIWFPVYCFIFKWKIMTLFVDSPGGDCPRSEWLAGGSWHTGTAQVWGRGLPHPLRLLAQERHPGMPHHHQGEAQYRYWQTINVRSLFEVWMRLGFSSLCHVNMSYLHTQ